MASEDFRLVSALQESARRFKDKTPAVYSILFPTAQEVLNIKMMLSVQVNNNCNSKF